MNKIWNSKIFWFIIILIVVYCHLVPVTRTLFFWKSTDELSMWPPYMLIIAFPIALLPFIFVRFFPTSKVTRLIIKTKKVVKIIIIATFGFLIIWFGQWYSMRYFSKSFDKNIEQSEAFHTAYSYIKQDTLITNKIGIIKSHGGLGPYEYSEENANFNFIVYGTKEPAIVDIYLTNKSGWTVDTAIYRTE